MAFTDNTTVQELMDKALAYWDSVPQSLQWAFAGVGVIYVVGGVLSFIQLLLNAFILSGTNVCPPLAIAATFTTANDFFYH